MGARQLGPGAIGITGVLHQIPDLNLILAFAMTLTQAVFVGICARFDAVEGQHVKAVLRL
jgi:hypothetical protein